MKITNSIKVMKKYSYLMQQLVSRDFKVKYKRSVLGVLWSVLNPLFMMIVLSVVFSTLFKQGLNGLSYPVYLITGLVLFNYFTEATNLAMGSVVNNFGLITKVYMPKYIFPMSKVFSSAINLLFSMVALYLIILVEHSRISPTHLLLPFAILFILIFAMGMAMLLSALTVFFRDMFYIYGVIVTAWTYLTPIMYTTDFLQKGHQNILFILKLNPLYHYIEFARDCVLYNRVPSLREFLICLISSLVMLAIGMLFFRSKQDKFIYYI